MRRSDRYMPGPAQSGFIRNLARGPAQSHLPSGLSSHHSTCRTNQNLSEPELVVPGHFVQRTVLCKFVYLVTVAGRGGRLCRGLQLSLSPS